MVFDEAGAAAAVAAQPPPVIKAEGLGPEATKVFHRLVPRYSGQLFGGENPKDPMFAEESDRSFWPEGDRVIAKRVTAAQRRDIASGKATRKFTVAQTIAKIIK